MSVIPAGIGAAAVAASGLRPVKRSQVMTVPTFFAGWMASEASIPLMAIQGVALARDLWRADFHNRGDLARLGLRVGALAGLAATLAESRRVDEDFEKALTGLVSPEAMQLRPRSDRRGAIMPAFMGARGRRRLRNVTYAEVDGAKLKLDIYQPPQDVTDAPVFFYIHGGAWVLGSKDNQGIPLCNHLSNHGWVCVNVNYRLSPRVRAPEHLIDCKRALAWVRDHIATYGGDPGFVAVGGGSAGGHLTALMALTAGEARYQPGFEQADTSVQAAVPLYGVYDLADEMGFNGGPEFRRFLEMTVFGRTFAEARQEFRDYSPINLVHSAAPPTLVVHGSRDNLVPVEGAHPFVEALTAASDNVVRFAEVSGAHHAFDIFPSPRSVKAIEYIERFLDAAHGAYRAGRRLGDAGVDRLPVLDAPGGNSNGAAAQTAAAETVAAELGANPTGALPTVA